MKNLLIEAVVISILFISMYIGARICDKSMPKVTPKPYIDSPKIDSLTHKDSVIERRVTIYKTKYQSVRDTILKHDTVYQFITVKELISACDSTIKAQCDQIAIKDSTIVQFRKELKIAKDSGYIYSMMYQDANGKYMSLVKSNRKAKFITGGIIAGALVKIFFIK